jgi:hypothetical protein
MSDIDITTGRAHVNVEATIYGEYPDLVIDQLRAAIGVACRAIDTDAARQLADDVRVTR